MITVRENHQWNHLEQYCLLLYKFRVLNGPLQVTNNVMTTYYIQLDVYNSTIANNIL